MSADGAPELDVRDAGPPARASGELLGTTIARWRERTADELGIPKGLTIGTGHQVEWWHPGIVAKFQWAAARSAESPPVWLAVDTDVRDPGEIRLPVVDRGELRSAVHRFGPRLARGAAPAGRPASVPAPFEGGAAMPALACVADGIARAHDALLRHADEHDAVRQVLRALADCTPGIGAPGAIVRTSQLLATGIGSALLDRAQEDPTACARAFNEAVALVPRVAAALREDGTPGTELPFWTRGSDGTRERVRAADLARLRADGAPLWPRAFLTSLVARAALCDRFVHGLGGGIYERATEAFARRWLGAELPPIDVVSATLRLPFPADDGPPPVGAAERRRWWFDPEGGGTGPSDAKRAALDEIASLPRGSAERRSRWRRMHAELDGARRARACDLAELEARAHADRARAREAALRRDRTWAAVLHPTESVSRLAESLRLRAR